MEFIKYILLGILQGFTEPLPISSSGHLVLAEHLFNIGPLSDVNFEIIVNFGSFLAIFLIFWKDIVHLVSSFFTYLFNKKKRKSVAKEFKYCLMIIVGSIPVGIAGVLFKDAIDNFSNNTMILGIAFLITAFLLFLVKGSKGKKEDLL